MLTTCLFDQSVTLHHISSALRHYAPLRPTKDEIASPPRTEHIIAQSRSRDGMTLPFQKASFRPWARAIRNCRGWGDGHRHSPTLYMRTARQRLIDLLLQGCWQFIERQLQTVGNKLFRMLDHCVGMYTIAQHNASKQKR